MLNNDVMDYRLELGEICPQAKSGAKIYFFGTGRNFECFRRLYKYIAKTNLEEYAFAFIDNDVSKQGKLHYGKPIISPDEVTPGDSVVLITVSNHTGLGIDYQMMDKGFLWESNLLALHTTFHKVLKSWIYKRIMRFNNKHLNERCFIIGNGSSLKIEDLEMLKNESTFAMNKVYKCFNETNWRPTYYVLNDAHNSQEVFAEGIIQCPIFSCYSRVIALINDKYEINLSNTYFYDLNYIVQERPFEYGKTPFGEYPDIFFDGMTTSYTCLQLAVFMGFRTIYLLGMDNNYSVMLKNTGEVCFSNANDYFLPNYRDYAENNFLSKYKDNAYSSIQIDIVNSSYQSARDYAEKNGIKIYNATRGGKLDIFERVDFDKLFEKNYN